MSHSNFWDESGEALSHATICLQKPKPSSALQKLFSLGEPVLYTSTPHPSTPAVISQTCAKNPTLIKLLNFTALLQETQRAREHIINMVKIQSAKSSLWNILKNHL